MRPKFRPSVERLETLSLLSAGLTLSMTTDKPSYVAGQVVTLKLTETNTGTTSLKVTDKPSGVLFSVETPGGATVWTDAGVSKPMFATVQTLKPGQSLSYTETWKSTQTGSLQALAQDKTLNASAEASFGVTSPAPAAEPGDIAWTLSALNELGSGKGVVLTAKETNTTNHDVTISLAGDNFTILGANGATVWRSGGGLTVLYNMPTSTPTMVLAPGQSFSFSQTWDGREKNLLTGAETSAAPAGTYKLYTAASYLGETAAPTTIQVPTPSTAKAPSTPSGPSAFFF